MALWNYACPWQKKQVFLVNCVYPADITFHAAEKQYCYSLAGKKRADIIIKTLWRYRQ
jgi:hypothetical protein